MTIAIQKVHFINVNGQIKIKEIGQFSQLNIIQKHKMISVLSHIDNFKLLIKVMQSSLRIVK